MVKLIKKLQEGGGMPFMVYTPNPISSPIPATSGASTTDDKSKTEDNLQKMLTKLLIDIISTKGLPSDVDALLKQLSEFSTSLTGEADINSLLSSPQGYNMVLSLLAKLNTNQAKVLKAKDNLYSNGGLNEAAMTTNGGVLVYDESGTMKPVSITTYAKDPSKYQIITNNELLQLRTYSKEGAFNNQITSILENGLGMDKVRSEITDVISKLKTIKQTQDEFMSPDLIEALKGINELTGIAKVTNSNETYSQDHKNSAKLYLWSTLSPQSKNLLKLKAALQGLDLETGALLLIESAIALQTPVITSLQVNLSDVSGLGGSGSKSGEKITSPDFRTRIQSDMYKKTTGSINLGGNVQIDSTAYVFNRPEDIDGKIITEGTSITDVISKSFGGTVDSSNIYLGDLKINVAEAKKIAYTGEPGASVTLPAIKYGNTILPDFDAINRMNDANNYIKENNITDPEKIQSVYEKHNVLLYMPGNPMADAYTAEFIQLPGYAYDSGLIENTNSPFLRKLKGNEETTAEKLIKLAYTGDVNGKLDYTNLIFPDDVYKTNVYIAKSSSVMDTGAGAITIPKTDYATAMKRESILETKKKMELNKIASGAITSKNVYNN